MRALAIGVVFVLAGCGSAEDASKGSLPPPRCERVSQTVVRMISAGVDAGVSLRGVRAVRSHDFRRVWLVSADLQSDGLAGSDDLATWAVNRVRGGAAASITILSADEVAKSFSDWGDLPGGGQSADGYVESHDCTAYALRGS